MAQGKPPGRGGKVKDRSREDVRSTRRPKRRKPNETPQPMGDPPRAGRRAPVQDPPHGGKRHPKKHAGWNQGEPHEAESEVLVPHGRASEITIPVAWRVSTPMRES